MSPRTRITDEQILDQDFVNESEFNQFFSTVVITGTETSTGLTQNFDTYFPGRGLIQSGPGIVTVTGANFIQVFSTALSNAVVGDSFISVTSGTNTLSLSADAITGIANNVTVISGTSTVTISGMVTVASGIAYLVDATRGGKSLSVDRPLFNFGFNGLADGNYLHTATSNHASTGFPIYRPATITSVSAWFPSGPNGKQFELRKNGAAISIKTFLVNPNLMFIDDAENIDLNKGDRLQVFVSSALTGARDPVVNIEIAWRLL